MFRRWAIIIIGSCVPAILLCGPAVGAAARLDVGAPATTLSGVDLSGTSHDIASFKGKWVFVDFWATWCGPCMQDLPNVVELSKTLQSRSDFSVLSVSLDETQSHELVQQTARDYAINYPVLFDGQGWRSPLAETWGITSIPATFLINPQGEIVARDIPAAAVPQLIGQQSASDYQPMRIMTSEETLPDSPSTGRRNLRDIRISLDFDPQSFLPRKYYLYVACGARPAQGQAAKNDLRYEVNFAPSDNGQHFAVKVERATGVSYLTDVFKQFEQVDPGAMSQNDSPDISVEIDQASRRFTFIVPLPNTCPSMSYALSLFDDNLGQYVNNGLVEVNLVGY